MDLTCALMTAKWAWYEWGWWGVRERRSQRAGQDSCSRAYNCPCVCCFAKKWTMTEPSTCNGHQPLVDVSKFYFQFISKGTEIPILKPPQCLYCHNFHNRKATVCFSKELQLIWGNLLEQHVYRLLYMLWWDHLSHNFLKQFTCFLWWKRRSGASWIISSNC